MYSLNPCGKLVKPLLGPYTSEAVGPIVTEYRRLAQTVFSHSKVKDISTLVAGAGALGNEVVKTLGLLGLGKINVADPDRVEPNNLTRSLFLRSPDAVGRNKAEVLAKSARELFPDTDVVSISKEIADIGFQELAATDLIFGCVDNDLARLETAYISTQLDVPVVDGGLATSDYSRGRVSYFPGRSGACFSCRLTHQRRRELLSLWEAASRPCWLEVDDLERRSYPSTPMMAAVVGAMQVELGLRQLLEPGKSKDSPAMTVEIALDPVQRTDVFSMAVSSTCPFHTPLGTRLAPQGLTSKMTVEDLLNQGRPEGNEPRRARLVLDWPICTSARCADCGYRWSPMARLAAFRKSGACPSCASRHFREEEVIRVVERGSRWAGLTLVELGLPEGHLHLIESGLETLL